ncbi:hypothetical protein [Microbacterium terricola]|uniref:DUF4430 domain-containing protein n=1 Tax=Microbacterium terricola TaxID=344163 RepID=A0ABM8E1J4_9MICO|nr:hypothetical protein [Microbacterium terricola]UYK40605.1 hypothetical protein OAU46_02820 [Microbacterium terricola]BDV31665.1 hypothetical protein Microterr_23250 [Microbacterium terricola]
MTTKPLLLAATALLALSLSACAGGAAPAASSPSGTPEASAPADCAGVTVIIDASAIDGDSSASCVATDAAIGAADALAQADVTTEGTEEYGDQVVCRVNGEPAADLALPAEDGSEYFEECASMPAAFAYWSLWVQSDGGEWGYAQEGLSTLQLQPGDRVELLFTLNGEPAEPAA